MQVEKESSPQKRSARKIVVLALAFLLILILLAVFVVPAFVSSEKGRKTILARINATIDGRMNFDGLSMGWLKGLKVTDLSFSDNSGRASVEVRQIATKPCYGSILMGSLSFGETIIDEPKVQINLQTPEPQPSQQPVKKTAAPGQAKPIVLPIEKIDLVVNDGSLKVTSAEAGTVEVSQINSRLNLNPPGRQTDFDIDMTVADRAKTSKIHTSGSAIPNQQTGWSLKGTSGDLTVEVNDLDLGSLGPVFALAGVEIQAKGSISGNLNSRIKDGRLENLTAKVEANGLDVTGPAFKNDRLSTNRLDIDVKLHSEGRKINIDKLVVDSDWADAEATGVVPTTFKSLAEFLKPDSAYNLRTSFKCDLAAAFSQMPRTLGLKEGTNVTSGRLTGSIETATKDGQKKIAAQANLIGLQGTVGEKTIALAEPVKAEARITSDSSGIKYDKLNLSASFAGIDCTGTGELLKYSADVDLARLQSELGQFVDMGRYQMAGKLLSTGQVRGSREKITVAGSSVIEGLRLSSKDTPPVFEPRTDVAFSATADLPAGILNVDSIEAKAGFGRVGIKNAVLPLDKKAGKAMTLPVSADVDLAKLMPFAVLFASLPQEMQLTGTAEADISVSSIGGIYRIVTDRTLVKDLELSYPDKEPFQQQQVLIVCDLEVNPVEKSIDVKKFKLVSPQIKIEGSLQQTGTDGKTRLEGAVDCEYDWAAVGTAVSAFLPPGLQLHGKRTDSIHFSSQYPTGRPDELLANLSTSGRLGFEKAEYLGLDFGPTDVDVQIENGLLKIAPFSTTVNNGQLSFAGEADFNQKPTLLKIPAPIQIAKDIQINDKTTGPLLKYLNPIFSNAVNVTGIANFNCQRLAIPLARASKNDIEVAGTVSLDRVRLQASDLLGQILSTIGSTTAGRDITVHPTEFTLADGFLRYDNMQMDIGASPVNFKGVIGLDKSLDMRVTLPYTTAGRTARIDRETAGQRISLPLRGTVDKPELDLGRLLEEQLKGRLQQELRKGLEELLKR